MALHELLNKGAARATLPALVICGASVFIASISSLLEVAGVNTIQVLGIIAVGSFTISYWALREILKRSAEEKPVLPSSDVEALIVEIRKLITALNPPTQKGRRKNNEKRVKKVGRDNEINQD